MVCVRGRCRQFQILQQNPQGDYVTECPQVGATEEWEIVNLTMDAHPIHIHLLQFQIINRQEVDVDQLSKKI